MTHSQITVIVVLVLVLLIVLGLIASHVGGSAIRTSGELRIGELSLSTDKILPGAPVTVQYNMISFGSIDDASMVMVRTPHDSLVVGEVSKAQLNTGNFLVKVPCDQSVYMGNKNEARFVLISNKDQHVIAQSNMFSLLPPGPECVY